MLGAHLAPLVKNAVLEADDLLEVAHVRRAGENVRLADDLGNFRRGFLEQVLDDVSEDDAESLADNNKTSKLKPVQR